MMRHHRLDHQFVDTLPASLDAGTLYISMKYATAAHRCCCGCGAEVVTPFTPTDWKMVFDGETVSLRPSIGNWNLPCRSHYVIDQDRVVEAGPWSDKRISAEWRRDRRAKAKYFGAADRPDEEEVASQEQPSAPIRRPWLRRLLAKLGG